MLGANEILKLKLISHKNVCALTQSGFDVSYFRRKRNIYIRFEILVRGKRSQSLASLYIISSNVVVWVSSERERYSCSKPKGEHSKLSHLSLALYRIMLFGISFIVDFISLLWSATAMLYSRSFMWQMRISYKCRVGWFCQKLKALLGSMCDRRPESVEILSCV